MNYDSNVNYIEKGHLDNGICQYPENIDKTVIDLYSPKAWNIDSPRQFDNPNIRIPEKRIQSHMRMNSHKNMSRDEHKTHIVRQIYSQYYSMHKCNELKELYATERGFVYDYVIRLRFDAKPQRPLICTTLDNMFIHSQSMPLKDSLLNDWMLIGNNMVMNIVSSLFFNFEYLNSFTYFNKHVRIENTLEPSEECGGIYEHALRDILTLYKIPTKTVDIGLILVY